MGLSGRQRSYRSQTSEQRLPTASTHPSSAPWPRNESEGQSQGTALPTTCARMPCFARGRVIRQAASFAVDVFGIGLLEELADELHRALVWLLALPVAVVAALLGARGG